VPFTLVHIENTAQKASENTDNTKTKENPDIANNAKTQQNKTILV